MQGSADGICKSQLHYFLIERICLTLQFLVPDFTIVQRYREVLCDEVEQFCPFSLLTGCVWHQYLQWYQDVNLSYDLQRSDK